MGLTSTDRACGPPAFLLHLLPSRVLALSQAPLLPFHSSCPAPTWAASRVQGLSVRGGTDTRETGGRGGTQVTLEIQEERTQVSQGRGGP